MSAADTAASVHADETHAEAAPAKVNLHLHVTGRRADGYHTLDSLVVFAPAVADRITAAPSDALSLRIEGPFAAGLAADDGNLVLRAARALAGAASVPRACAALTLRKALPVASGIGGGSADAAATLRALARLWRIDPARAAPLALPLGADVPVCLGGRPVVMGGVGETLRPAPPLPPFALLLVNPGVPVSTPAVFAARAGQAFRAAAAWPAAGWPNAASLAAHLASGTANDLEAPAIAIAPAIGAVLARLRAADGCLLARMSGSGGTCFGLFAATEAAAAAGRALAETGWWWGASPAGGEAAQK